MLKIPCYLAPICLTSTASPHYKTPHIDHGPQDEPTTVEEALAVIQHTHERWVSLMAGEAQHDADFWLGEDAVESKAEAEGDW